MYLEGHCNCGGVTYHSDTALEFSAICHCKTCQRQTSAAASLVVGVKDSAFHVEGESLGTFVTHGDSGQDVYRSFCRNCGSPIFSKCDAIPGLVFIKAGTLNDTSVLDPKIELYLQDAQPWTPRIEGADCFDRGM